LSGPAAASATVPLPILTVLPELLASLREVSNAVLVAPPGAGKTTAVAPALLDEDWCTGQIWLLAPRRLAARAAAERIAAIAGEEPGGKIGYLTRLESKVSARTRLIVMTQGVLRRRIQDDPALEGISALLFDEVHERSVDGDFGLALALDAQGGLRPELRILAMSATLDGARFSTLLGNAPVIHSEGRAFPVDLRHIGRAAEARIEDSMATAVKRALTEEAEGDILAFLPGAGEIARTAERLAGLHESISIHPLHGSLEPAAQRTALRPAAPGARKIILATSIAETSLTIDGVRIVVDSGLARRPRHDLAAGMTRLVTERASQAAVIQRAGRAGRQRAGVAYRLWEAAATNGLPLYDPPELLESDLTGLVLECALWGVDDPARLRWLDPPPAPSVTEARRRLADIDALDEAGRVTAHGKALAALPLDPRLSHMLIDAARRDEASTAARIAALLTERGLGGPDLDLTRRMQGWARDRSPRAQAARGLARRWTQLAGARWLEELDEPDAIARAVAAAYPGRIARRRDGRGEDWISAGGRAFKLDGTHPLARAEWLAVADIQGSAAGARILSAVAIEEADVLTMAAGRIVERRTVRWRSDLAGVECLRERMLGAIRLSSGPDDAPDRAAIIAALSDSLRQNGLRLMPWGNAAEALRTRAAFAGEVALDDSTLLAEADDWLDEVLPDGARRLSAIPASALHDLLVRRLGWDIARRIDALAPAEFTSPAGSRHAIDYAAPAGPTVEMRVQALFGLATHPVVGVERIPLVLSLTSPAGRPIQTTRDLPGFWAGSWAAVAKEMRGRYPRHPWPDDPASATATLRTKAADARTRS
jgi:ATP-dependent helicase HrpB